MSASFFNNKTIIPDDNQFAAALGNSYPLCNKIRDFIIEKYGDATPEWKFYGPKSGWVLKMLLKKKNLFFLVPCNGYFRVAFTLGEKAFDSIMASDLPDNIKAQWNMATNHTEGRTVSFDVKDDRDFLLIARHIAIKLANS